MGDQNAANSTESATSNVDASVEPVLSESIQENQPATNDAASKKPMRSRERRNRGRVANHDKKKSSKLCTYFLASKCKYGEKCLFSHDMPPAKVSELPADASVAITDENSEQTQPVVMAVVPSASSAPPRAVVRPKKLTICAADKGTPAHRNIRTSDIHYFRRRYPASKRSEVDGGTELTFPYEITNPEWVFDVRSLDFTIQIPKEHPYVAPRLYVVKTDVLPDVLCTHIDSQLNDMISAKITQYVANDNFEIIGKWLVRTIDRNIFDIFVAGLKKTKLVKEAEACGIKCVPLPSVKYDSDDEKKEQEITPTLKKLEKGRSSKSDDSEKENRETEESKRALALKQEQEEKRDAASAIDIRIQWSDSTGNIGTLKATSMTIAVSCLKCPASDYFTCKDGQRKAARCRRCGVGQSVLYKSEFAHQNSNLIGTLNLKGCKPVDCVLLQCQFKASCLNCSREFEVVNLSNGVVNKSWCHDCHTKCEFSIFTTAFSGNFLLIAKEDNSVPRRTQKKKVDLGPVIVVGQPLPDRGTCQHYKKSFRWFRFPCCGKTFPCDVCHEEAKMGHEMSFASRIICGMCSFEQPYAKDKPCNSCNESTVKSKSAHWEGGKGCRNKLFMSRNDDRKHKNSSLKTVAKKRTGPSSPPAPFFSNAARRNNP